MTAAIDPRSPELNYVVVQGIRSPGRATISGAGIPYVWDVQQPYGMTGAVTIYKGRGPVRFTLTIALWEPAHFLAWPVFAKLLEPPKPGIKLVVEMKHPHLSAADVKGVAIEHFGQLERQTSGVWTSVSQCLEYRAPLPALVKPRGSIPGPDKGAPMTPQTEADKALAQAQAEITAARARASK